MTFDVSRFVKHETDIIGRNNHSATKVLSVSLTSLLYDSTRHIINHYKAINRKDAFLLFSATTTNDMASSIKHTGKHDSL